MKTIFDGWVGNRKTNSLADYIEQAQYIVYGVMEAVRGEEAVEVYRLEILRILFGDLDPHQSLAVDPACARRTVRLGFQSRREVVAFSLQGEAELSGDDLLLPVILDPISDEKYVKIPPELAEKNTRRESLTGKWKTARNRPPTPADLNNAPFVPFEEFMTNLGDLCRDLR